MAIIAGKFFNIANRYFQIHLFMKTDFVQPFRKNINKNGKALCFFKPCLLPHYKNLFLKMVQTKVSELS